MTTSHTKSRRSKQLLRKSSNISRYIYIQQRGEATHVLRKSKAEEITSLEEEQKVEDVLEKEQRYLYHERVEGEG